MPTLTTGKYDRMVTLSELRASLLKYRRRVQRGEVLRVEYYSHPIAWLMAADKARKLEVPDERTITRKTTEFRQKMTESWEALDSEKIDIVWLEYHETIKMALVSVRVWEDENE